MKNIHQDIADLLKGGEAIVLATILERQGSAPRSIGARMVIRKDGTILGTIGGGLLEAQVCEAGTQAYIDQRTTIEDYHFNARQASDLGMICGGSVRILVQYIPAEDKQAFELFQGVSQFLKSHERAWLVTNILNDAHSQNVKRVYQGILSKSGALTGTLGFPASQLLQAAQGLRGSDPAWLQVEGQPILFEPVHTQGRVVIFGAGHISQMLAPLTAWVGFYTLVLDDRQEFANRQRFTSVDEVLVVESFTDCFNQLQIDADTYLVIVTRGHLDDQKVLRKALRTPAGYIGMIGSLRKRDLIYKELLASGFSTTDLKRVRSPIGLSIGAETPEEIAISILAELIQARAHNNT